MVQLALVIPCFNEEKRLDSQSFLAFINQFPQVAILFVNDGSLDKTLTIIKELSESVPGNRISYLDLPQNMGKAEAVRHGMLHLLGPGISDSHPYPYIGFWDADLATPLIESVSMLEYGKKQEMEFIFGIRLRRLGAHVERRASRHYLGRVFATVVSLVLKLPVYDTQCGAKIFASKNVASLFDKPFISKWLFDVEIYFRMKKLKVLLDKICEYPLLQWAEIGGSKVGLRHFLMAPWQLYKIYFYYK